MTGSHPRSARDVVEELFRRQRAADDTVLDDLVATDMVNHAAGPQGREGLRQILQTIERDLGPISFEQHHLVGEGDLVVQHVTMHGTGDVETSVRNSSAWSAVSESMRYSTTAAPDTAARSASRCARSTYSASTRMATHSRVTTSPRSPRTGRRRWP